MINPPGLVATTFRVIPTKPEDRDVRIEARDYSADKSKVTSWAVVDCGICLVRGTDDSWEWESEPSPSNRTDEFIARARFLTVAEAFMAYAIASHR